MGILGRGKGPFGIPVAYTSIFFMTITIWLIFLTLSSYLVKTQQIFISLISIASAIMFTGIIFILSKKRE